MKWDEQCYSDIFFELSLKELLLSETGSAMLMELNQIKATGTPT
jgi:hypothetical protein